jgi:hypothetical protein
MEELQATIIMLHAMVESEKRASAAALKLKTDVRQTELRVMQLMNEQGLTHVGHAGLLAKIKHTTQYNASDWLQIYDRIQRTGEFDLLHKRLSSTAVRERFKAGDMIAGVGTVEVPALVITLDGGNL